MEGRDDREFLDLCEKIAARLPGMGKWFKDPVVFLPGAPHVSAETLEAGRRILRSQTDICP